MAETLNTTAIQKIYRAGPIVMLIPMYVLALGLALASAALGDPLNSAEWYVSGPMFALLAVMVIWHFMLTLTEQRVLLYLLYALIHIPLFTIAWIGALMLAVRFAD